jgi:hypothetical protein
MPRERPPILLVLGWCCLGFTLFYLGWLLVYYSSHLVDMAGVVFGSADALDSLRQHDRARTSAIFLTVLPFCLEVALMGVLGWCGFGLLTVRGSARWSVLFFCLAIIPVALLHTVLQLTWLTKPNWPVALTPFVMDAVVIQFAIVLCGTMFLPGVALTYRGNAGQDTAGRQA